MSVQRFKSLEPTADLPQLLAVLGSKRPSNGLSPQGSWYSIKNVSDTHAEIWIYDYIGEGGVTANAFARDIAAIKANNIALMVNSPGGSVFDGTAIYTAIARHKAHITAYVDSLAASAASFIIMAADEIVMMPHSRMVIHDAQGGLAVNGTAADYQELADFLDKESDNIASIYAEKAGGTTAEWRARMKKETYLSDTEAVEIGLADRVGGDEPQQTIKVQADWDLSGLKDSALLHQPAPTLEGLLGKHSLKEAVTTAGGR